MAATVSRVILRLVQYLDSSQSTSLLVPLLPLQLSQHLAMFSRVTMRASLMMCSHVGRSRRLVAVAEPYDHEYFEQVHFVHSMA